ncbi:MAG: hypothetical protein J5824_00620, partial [Lachnospiraceae bacterium]|nr:hypothetical protein [Lachnospiraceae bacterium]
MKARRLLKSIIVLLLVVAIILDPTLISSVSALTGDEGISKEAGKNYYVWNDGKVNVTAVLSDAGSIPDDARLVVKAIDSSSLNYDAYMDALNNSSESSYRYNEENTLLYDISFIKDGIEFEPESGSVSIFFRFLDNQLSELIDEREATEVNVIHLPLTDDIKDKYDTTGEAQNIDANDIDVQVLASSVNIGDETVSFSTGELSVFAYTVDFEYTDPDTGSVYTYNLKGAGSITLKELAVILGITTSDEADEFIANVADVKFSNSDLLTINNSSDEGWILTSLVPFSSDEILVITMTDGSLIEVRVTDVQESSDLSNFLVNVVVTGATQNSNGNYEVEAGKEYSIILSFEEGSSFQFDNDAELIYNMPSGINIMEQQQGPFKINIVYKGRTYQVDASYVLTTDGVLKVRFDQTDPDYPRLVDSTNVSFRYTYWAEFDGSEDVIKFSEDIEREIIFDEPDPGQAYAEKTATYDEATGTFHYTITVTATGDVTDVNVKDTVLGDALIVNTSSLVIAGNSSTPSGSINSSGFDYTFPTMEKDEVITIKYDASIDFSKDLDKDGKITADQTKNTISVEPEPGDPHTSEYSREIRYKYAVKKDGTEAGTTSSGDKIINWEIDYNPLALVAVGGDRITDSISADSADYMKYYGSGITVNAYDRSGNLAYTRNINYSDLTSHSDSSWTYTIPTSDTTPYSYVITYQTIVDMESINGIGTAVTLSNTANNDGGSIRIAPENEVAVNKEAESYTTEEVSWKTTLSIPQGGLTRAIVTDILPQRLIDGVMYYDILKEGTLDITGLLPGESYDVSTTTGGILITFFKDTAKTQPGLQAYPGGHIVTVKLTTKVNQEWLQKGYAAGSGYLLDHTNFINLNGTQDSATVTYGKPGISKTAVTSDEESFKFTLTISGLKEEPLIITDTFDTSLLEVDTSKVSDSEHMHIFGGTQWSQINGAPVTYTDTENGIIISANTVPKQPNGTYYPYYRIDYYLKLKDGVNLKDLAIANGGEYDIVNTAVWAGHDTDYTYKVLYDFIDKDLLNEGELGGRNRDAQYRITFNPSKSTLNGGEPLTMTDVLSDNMSIDYGSISITTDPPGVSIPYSISGGKDEFGNPDGTTVATFTVPDSTKVVVEYTANVRGNGSQKIINKVSVNGKDEISESRKDYGDADEGQGAVASFRIIKVDGYDANKKLPGVRFKIFAENPNLDFGEGQNHAKEIELVTDQNGEILLDGHTYTFYFNECYHVQEIEPAEDYGKISFDYLVTLTNNMSLVDYGHYIYYFSDSMQIKNWPLEGLVVEKEVESDENADKDRYYTFRISILNDDGTVNTNFNEKNGDDTFVNGVVEFQLKDKEQKMFWGFTKGTKYKVEEIDAEGFVTTISYTVFDSEGNATEIRKDTGTSHSGELTQEEEVIVFKNSKHEDFGSLKIKKNVQYNGYATTSTKADGTYYFTITGPNGYSSTQTITITNGVSNEIQIDDLEPGTYTVTEDISSNPEGMELVGSNGISIEVEAGETAEIKTAEFTNNLTEVGSLKIRKYVQYNGRPTTSTKADGIYTFVITDSEGTVKATATITIANGVSDVVQVDNLEPGTYTVTEDVDSNPEGMELVGSNGVSVEVNVGETAEIETAEFTNNLTELGSLKIKKNVLYNGRETTSTKADGTYSFTITGPYEYTSTITLTIENGESEEVQIDGLEPGTYTVTEDVSSNPNGMELVGSNGVTVDVNVGETAEIETAEFTNNLTELGS